MTGQTTRIDDVLLKKLCDLWKQEKFPISAIIEQLRQEFKIVQCAGWERLILYGRTHDNEMNEEVIGLLVSIAPGIVILDTDNDDCLRPLSGLLKRADPPRTQLFDLRPFSPSHFSAHLSIYPSTFPPKNRRYEICPAWIYWQIGAGHGESYMALGIDPGRWEVLRQWFDKWLPE